MRRRRRNMKLPSEEKLPSELWTEVLARLPAKTLLRFRCVCKSWRFLIDDPNFISMNITLSKNNREKRQILTVEEVSRRHLVLKTFRIDPTFRKSGEIIRFYSKNHQYFHNYVNGLILIDNPIHGSVMLWNPSIRKSLILPPCPLGYGEYKYVLGLDSSSNDYKVFVFDKNLSRAAIYDLTKRSWRTKSIHYLQNVSSFHKTSVYSKGSVHWMDEQCNFLVSLDCGSEILTCIGLPSKRESRFLFKLGESVAIFDVHGDGGCCIWVMEKYDVEESHVWTKWYTGSFFLQDYRHVNIDHTIFYVEKSGMFFIDIPSYASERVRVRVSVCLLHVETDKVEVKRKLAPHIWIEFMDTFVESLLLSNGLGCQTLKESLASLHQYPSGSYDSE